MSTPTPYVASVDESQRFSSVNRVCPVCDGHSKLPQGQGTRCYGFLSGDSRYAHCSREELATRLTEDKSGGTYAHRLDGPCRCGVTHGDSRPTSTQNSQRKTKRNASKQAKPAQIYDSLEDAAKAVERMAKGRVVDRYDYEDLNGSSRYYVWRVDMGDGNKTFRQGRPVDGGYVLNSEGVGLIPYHLPELRNAIAAGDTVHVCEGEKDVHALEGAMGVATCNPMGAGKDVAQYAEYFRDAEHVIVIADRDEVGRKHAQKWADVLAPVVGKVEIREPVDGKDAHEALVSLGFNLDQAFRPPRPEVDTSRFVHVGADAYAFLRAAPEPEWLVPDFLRIGKTTVLGGSTMTGKSWFALQVGSSIAAGYPVWPGVDGHASEGVVVFIGYDPHMTVEDVSRRLESLDNGRHREAQGMQSRAWQDRFVTVGSSEQTGAFPIDRYRLDEDGCKRIATEILSPIERERGPIRAIVVDTLSTALPLGVDENDNPAMTAVISRLSGLALDFKAAALTVHHPTKANSTAGSKFESWQPFSYFRGAGAIPSAAGVLAGMWAPRDHPAHRVLTCWSNSGSRRRTWFEVADEERGAKGMIDHWWPVPPRDGDSQDVDTGTYMEDLARAFAGDAAERLSMRKFTSGSQGTRVGSEPSGASKAKATKLLEWGISAGILERESGGKQRVYLTQDGLRSVSPFREVSDAA